MPGPSHIDLDNPGDCRLYAELYERTHQQVRSLTHLLDVAQQQLEAAKRQRDRWYKAASFYKSCALSGEIPSAAIIAEMEQDLT